MISKMLAKRRFSLIPNPKKEVPVHFEEDQEVNLKNNSLNKSQRLPYEYNFGDTTDPEEKKVPSKKTKKRIKKNKKKKKKLKNKKKNPFLKELGEIENFNFKMKLKNNSKKEKEEKDYKDVHGVNYNILEDPPTDENIEIKSKEEDNLKFEGL